MDSLKKRYGFPISSCIIPFFRFFIISLAIWETDFYSNSRENLFVIEIEKTGVILHIIRIPNWETAYFIETV